MKKLTLILLLVVLCMCVTAFRCGSCEPPDCTETIECDSTGWNCHTVRHHRVAPQFESFTSETQAEDFVGILDLANPWQSKPSDNPQLTITFKDSSGQDIQQTFSLTPASQEITDTISKVDKDTKPYSFVISDPTALNSFLSNASVSADANKSSSIDFGFSITQVDCAAQSGKYLNHRVLVILQV